MNKKSLFVVVLIVIAVALIYFFFAKRPVVAPSPSATVIPEQSSPTTLKDLFSKGIAQSCTFVNEHGGGTIYISGSKIRGDFTSETNEKTIKSHMIVDDKTSYSWNDGDSTGIKMTFDVFATSTESAAGGGLINGNVSMDYKCSPWITDSSVFALPGDVNFTSFEVPTSSDTSSSQCSYCNNLTGDDKTQCLTALKCK